MPIVKITFIECYISHLKTLHLQKRIYYITKYMFFYLYILYNNLIPQKKKNNLFLQLIRIQELIFFMEEHKIYIL